MGRFQRGDAGISIDGKPYALRLTMGALAEMDARLDVSGPLELAEKLKSFSVDSKHNVHAFVLLECLLRPALPSGAVDIQALALRADPQVFMPLIAQVFEESL